MNKLGFLLFKNTATNYVMLAVKMISAIFITRIMFLNLGDLYGFWSLLWAVFGYSLFLDFGFGRTVQKYTAESGAENDMGHYSNIVSAVFWTYVVESLLIIAATGVMTFHINDIFKLEGNEEAIWYYREVFLVFGIGISLVFATGIFSEILVGLNRIYLRNYVLIVNKAIELAGVVLIFHFGGGLLALAVFTMILGLCSNIVLAVIVMKLLPGLRLNFSGLNLKTFRHIASFSTFAYLLTIADMIILKSDRVILGIITGVGGVTIYQLGTRIPEMVGILSSQFQENISPLAASMHKGGEGERLKIIMFHSSRLVVFISTGAFLLFSILAQPVMFVWLKVEGGPSISVTWIMMASGYLLVTLKCLPTHYLFMTGHHRGVALAVLIGCLLKIPLTIALVKIAGAPGAAMSTLIPTAIIGGFVLFPLFVRLSGYSGWRYLTGVFLPSMVTCVPAAAVPLVMVFLIPVTQWNLGYLILALGSGGIPYLLVGWLMVIDKEERSSINGFLLSLHARWRERRAA